MTMKPGGHTFYIGQRKCNILIPTAAWPSQHFSIFISECNQQKWFGIGLFIRQIKEQLHRVIISIVIGALAPPNNIA